ncbi:MAG: Holliday junction resolvase RuvX [Rickettsia endosymbiont of Ixodes persulcatus]|nr:Holliday junction resolvase RuvX [Rickettsia endosymbiont of Ixodes persulcatus]MCZ6901873.1 Holliday junction resolvase RuvX [Rickettsia endosymbiont of Ixodes persulcatus]MCZ6903587.1 Holliday junction resolvase RuvX [Rickettsia endosymbiont of Ixodes persulcatus]MCZ6908788.1 Holliday junction resolvase RuvX [Rickettsia endosymbiont of Ixodes persulcatus]MCZ6910196.1 Holliday junction resolvase RuvX [Rickettsia endosymbiont of Ixodes persulcatus]
MIIKNLQEFYRLLILNAPLIAIDYGSKKLGMAMSNGEWSIAMPLNTITEVNKKAVITSLLNIIEKYKICGVVIGLPIDMSGVVTQQTNIVMKFVEELAKSTNLPIYLQDERLTTKAANNFLKSFGVKRKDRNNNDDVVAASMILETVLDSIKRF